MLLHLLLVLLLGNTPGGTARPGDGVWGRLSVRLAGPSGPAPDGAAIGLPEPDNGAAGPAPRRRYGGAVRHADAPPPPSTPGAARLGRWNERPTGIEETVPQAPSLAAPPAPAPARLARPIAARPTLDAAPPDLAPLPALAPLEPSLRPMPGLSAPAAAPARLTAPSLSREAAAPAGMAPMPALAPIERPEPNLKTLSAPARPADVNLERLTAPALPPAAMAPMRDTPMPALATDPLDTPAPARPAVDSTAVPRTGTPVDVNAQPGASPAAGAATAATGAPEAGSRLGRDVATAPSAAASAPRQPLNLSLPRGEISRQGSRGLLELMPHPPERKGKVEETIENAAKPDCRKVYQEFGLLAAVPLAVDAARSKGCRW